MSSKLTVSTWVVGQDHLGRIASHYACFDQISSCQRQGFAQSAAVVKDQGGAVEIDIGIGEGRSVSRVMELAELLSDIS
jgi:hypothetical protein